MRVIKVSQLLSKHEAHQFINHFTTKEILSETLAVGVVQIYKSIRHQWTILDTGVLYFLLDRASNCYRLKLYAFHDASYLWHQEIYNGFIYVCAEPFFHMFEGDDVVFGINFSDILEADELHRHLNLHVLKNTSNGARSPANIVTAVRRNFSWFTGFSLRNAKSKRKPSTNVIDIGSPMDFKHVTHVGFDGVFGETANQHIVTEIRRIVQSASEELNNADGPDRHVYVNMIAYELRNLALNADDVKRRRRRNMPEERQSPQSSQCSNPRPPIISWSYDADLKNISLPDKARTGIVEAGGRQLAANTITTAIARRCQARNYSDTEYDSDSGEEWV